METPLHLSLPSLHYSVGEPVISVYKGITWLSNLKSIWLLIDSEMQCILWISVMFEMISLGYSCHALFGNLALQKIKFIGKNFQEKWMQVIS
ncbi:hypothetical protein P3L10_032897 [Capsicum annuum]